MKLSRPAHYDKCAYLLTHITVTQKGFVKTRDALGNKHTWQDDVDCVALRAILKQDIIANDERTSRFADPMFGMF